MSRQPKTYLCPVCLNPATRDGTGCYFDCGECGARLVLKNGELQKTRAYNARSEAEKEEAGRVGYRMDADEFERLQG